jgi:hypothetical protein
MREIKDNGKLAFDYLSKRKRDEFADRVERKDIFTKETFSAILEGLPEDYRVRVMAALKIGGE